MNFNNNYNLNGNKRNQNEHRNLGLELLRNILCFWVISFHCLDYKNDIISYIVHINYHVPCFFVISFYFLYPIIQMKNIDKMKLRIIRIIIPYLVWPLIIWIIENLSFLIFHTNSYKRIISFNDLMIQFIVGRKFMKHLWFMFNLLFFSILFFIMSFFCSHFNFLFNLQIASIFSYIFQYSEINYIFFEKYSNCISHSIGYFVETMPFAHSAFLLYSSKFVEKLRINNIKSIIILTLILYLISKYNIFSRLRGYTYSGIDKNIASVILFNIFYLIPLDCSKPKFIFNLLRLITRYTQGIYCLHIYISYIILLSFNIKGTLFACFSIYFIGYIFSLIGSKIFHKTNLKYLF